MAYNYDTQEYDISRSRVCTVSVVLGSFSCQLRDERIFLSMCMINRL